MNYCRLIAARCFSHVDAEDLCQETWLRAVRAKRLPSDPMLRPWLRRVAHNVLLEMLRRSIRRYRRTAQAPTAFDPPEERTSVTGRVVRREVRGRVAKFLDGLSTIDRQLLLEHHCDGTPLRVVAVRLQMNEATAGKRCQRLLARCRRLGCLQDLR